MTPSTLRSRPAMLFALVLAAAGCSGTTESDRAGAAGGSAKPDAESEPWKVST